MWSSMKAKVQYIWARTQCTILAQNTLMWGIVGYAQQLKNNNYNLRKFTRIKMLLTCWQRQTLSKAWAMCQACWIGCKLSCSCNLVIMWLVLHNIIFVLIVKCYQDLRAICVVLDWLTIWRVVGLKKVMIVLRWWAFCGLLKE